MLKRILNFGVVSLIAIGLIFTANAPSFSEANWTQYKEKDPNISFLGPGWYGGRDPGATDGSSYVSLTPGAEYRFNFTGTQLRISSPKGYDKSSQLIIDGYIIKQPTYVDTIFGVKYLVTGLDDKEHSVRVVSLPNDNKLETWITPDSIEIASTGKLLPYNESVNVKSRVLDVEAEKNKIRVNDSLSVAVVINNIKEIAAEDIRITYDSDKLKFVGASEFSGFKIVKSMEKNGELRLIVASKGSENIVNSKKTLLTLNFIGVTTGEAKIDIVKGRVSDGIELEKDLLNEECGEAIVLIEPPLLIDVNKSGEFTLLDLAIDARHFGKDPKLAELQKYNTDIVVNSTIDEADLLEIAQQILLNTKYIF